MFRLICVLLAALLLSACTARSLSRPGSFRDALPAPAGPGPVIGVALSGGGSKAAPFALGVLEHLVVTGDLAKVDVISSVSGGGYAALYLYSRARDQASGANQRGCCPASPPLQDAFLDCLPYQYRALFPTQAEDKGPSIGSQPSRLCPSNYVNFISGDPYRFQNHLRGYQNLLSRDFRYEPTTLGREEVVRLSVGHGLTTLGTLIPHHLANSLFDWKLRLSPVARAYDLGIYRTWALPPKRLQSATKATIRKPEFAWEPLSFPQLHRLIGQSRSTCRAGETCESSLPNWIINASAAEQPVRQQLVEDAALRRVFVFSPDGYGSMLNGYDRWGNNEQEPALSVADAVATSAAFFDVSPPAGWGLATKVSAAAGQHLLNLSWGRVVPNYRITREQFLRRRAIHRALPFPLYAAHYNTYGPGGIHIRLADGGRTDNLGLFSLLMAGVTHAVVVDAASDDQGALGDLCALRSQFKLYQKAAGGDPDLDPKALSFGDILVDGLIFDGQLSSLTEWCDGKARESREKSSSHPLVRSWPAPVLKGCVVKPSFKGSTCKEAGTDLVAQLVILKPVIEERLNRPLEALLTQIGGPRRKKRPWALDRCAKDTLDQKTRDACTQLIHQSHCGEIDHLPCEALAFLMRSEVTFPQHNTALTTAHSSPFIFGAYRALGRYAASFVRLDSDPISPVRVRCPGATEWTVGNCPLVPAPAIATSELP